MRVLGLAENCDNGVRVIEFDERLTFAQLDEPMVAPPPHRNRDPELEPDS